MAKYNLSEEQKEIVKLVKILLIVLVILSLVYLGSRAFISKDLFNKDKDDSVSSETTTPEVNFDYTKTIIGTMFNRPYKEYYVMIYNSNNEKYTDYISLLTKYKGTTKLYVVDLNEAFNKKYQSEESNPLATSISELKLSDFTLVKIKNKKIAKYLETKEAMTSELGIK